MCTPLVTFSVQHLKSYVSAVARELFTLDAHCADFLFLDEYYVHLMVWHFPLHLLKVKQMWEDVV